VRARWVVAAGMLLVVAGGAAAIASIPARNGTITGCRNKQTGVLRVINAEVGQRCRAGEARLTWNQRGPAGPQGPQGAPGPQGPPGSDGGSGYELVYKDVHYDPVTDSAANPWGFQTPISEVVDCPGSRKATNGGVVDVIPDPDVPSEHPSGGPMPLGGFVGNDDDLNKGPHDPATVPFDPPETAAYRLPSRPTEDGSGWVVVGFLHHPGFGDSTSPSSPHQQYGTTVRFFASCVN
jgi:hypothetical protein